MPLKPMFSRAPLTMQPLAPLAPEAIALEGSARETLEKLCALALQAPMGPALAEGALACAYLCENAPLAEKVEQWLRVQLNVQGADGSLPLPAAEGIRVMLAVARLFAHQGEKTLLEPMMRYCACLRERWEELRLDGSVMGQAANLMELLLFLYNVTGKKALLHLMELTRRDAMDWSGLMSTFALSRPTAKLMPLEEMTAGRKAEGNDPSGFYTRQYLATFGPALAQGIRLPVLMGLYSGSARDLDAGYTGYEKIMRYHGTATGAFTADLHLAGGSPSAAVSGRAAGETARSLARVWQVTEKPGAAEALACLMENALPAFLPEGKLLPFLRVNSLSVNAGVKDCYAPGEAEETARETLAALLQGTAEGMRSAVTATATGAAVGLYVPGHYTLRLGREKAKLTLATSGERVTLTLSMKNPAEAELKLRIPSWTVEPMVQVNDEGGDAPETGKMFTLRRTFRDGDVITLLLPRKARLTEGYHQSLCVMRGDTLLAMPVQGENWRRALCDVRDTERGTEAVLLETSQWKTRVHVPADPPIAPRTEGKEERIILQPFAETACRIAAFPKGKQA